MDEVPFRLPTRAPFQLAYVVEDIEAAMRRWSAVLGVGPFFYFPHFPLLSAHHRGVPCSPDFAIALAFRGATCIELVCQRDRTPTVYTERVSRSGYGFHHVAFASDAFDADLAAYAQRGAELVTAATTAVGGRLAYLECGIGELVEVVEADEATHTFFGMVHDAAAGWDGRDPIRTLPG
jgi:hypothetical protein